MYDGAALIHCMKSHSSKTFEKDFEKGFQYVLLRNVAGLSVNPINLLWNRHTANSLKSGD